jgi:hypothetical protein
MEEENLPQPPPQQPSPPAAEPRQEVAWGQTDRPIHPAIDFDRERGIAFVTLPLMMRDGEQGSTGKKGASKTKPYLIAVGPNFRNCVPLELAALEFESEPVFLEARSRWAEAELHSFLACKRPVPSAGAVYTDMLKTLTRYVEFSRPEDAAVLSLYVMMTYVAYAMDSVPYIKLEGVKGSGKTKTCSILSRLAFNAVFTSSLTPAAVTRCVDGTRGALCCDEMEGLSSNGQFSQLLNGGYRRGGLVIRAGAKGQLNVFSSFGPKILASIEPLNPVLASRTILITLSPAADQTKARTAVTDSSDDWPRLRGMLYEWSLTDWKRVVETPVPEMPALANRGAELWGTILQLAAATGVTGLVEQLGAYATRSTTPAIPAAILNSLERLLVAGLASLPPVARSTDMATPEIMAAMRAVDGNRPPPSPQALGLALDRLRLYVTRRHTATGRRFTLDWNRITELANAIR